MKAAWKIAGLAATGMGLLGAALFVATQRQALHETLHENQLLRDSLVELEARVARLSEENERLALRPLFTNARPDGTASAQPSRELLQLRNEVTRLRPQATKAEQTRQAQRREAAAQLANAESELTKVTELREKNLVSEAELNKAQYAVDLLRAESAGDAAAVRRIRLRYAELELDRASKLFSQSFISKSEYDQAVRLVQSLRADQP
jgi:hypothetical protein